MKLPLGLAAAVVFLYSLGYPLATLSLQAMSPGPVLLLRFGCSAIILGAVALVRRSPWPRGKMLGHVAVVGLLTTATQFIASYTAIRMGLSAVLLALIVAANPLATAAIAAGVLGERISQRKVVALILAVVAVLAAFAGRLGQAGGIGWDILVALVALLGVSGGAVYQQRHVRGVDPIVLNTVGLTASLVPGLAFALLGPVEVYRPHQAIVAVTAMVLLSSVSGMTLYTAAVRRAGAAQVSMLFAVIPSGAAILTWILLGTRPDVGIVIGLVVGAFACWLGRNRSCTPGAVPSGRVRPQECLKAG